MKIKSLKINIHRKVVEMSVFVAGEVIADENEEGEEKSEIGSTKYQLIGVVVHSGQASGGHYYSYILHRYDQLSVYRLWQFHHNYLLSFIVLPIQSNLIIHVKLKFSASKCNADLSIL